MIELLKIKMAIKKKKPDFVRQDSHKIKKLKVNWRRPKGLHSKIRHSFKGHIKAVSVGFGSPAALRGVGKSGLKNILVHSIKELGSVSKEQEGITIAKAVGLKKRIEIAREAKNKGIFVFNIRDVDIFLKRVDEKLEEKKKGKEEKKKKKEEKKKEMIKKAEEKEKKEDKKEGTKDELAERIKEEEDKEKLEKEKILTKKV